MLLVIDYDAGNLLEQAKAAHFAINEGIKPGQLWGMRVDGRHFGVKRNKTTIRVYPQDREAGNRMREAG